jgi:hypothetical protein
VSQASRNVTDADDGFPGRQRLLIHDRHPLFTVAFRETLASAGVKTVRLPPRSPNLNAHAERFARSIKESCSGPPDPRIEENSVMSTRRHSSSTTCETHTYKLLLVDVESHFQNADGANTRIP